jgi:hypothetical protein
MMVQNNKRDEYCFGKYQIDSKIKHRILNEFYQRKNPQYAADLEPLAILKLINR